MMNAVKFSSALYKTLCMESRQRATCAERDLVRGTGLTDPGQGGSAPLPDIENGQGKEKGIVIEMGN